MTKEAKREERTTFTATSLNLTIGDARPVGEKQMLIFKLKMVTRK